MNGAILAVIAIVYTLMLGGVVRRLRCRVEELEKLVGKGGSK